MQTGPVKNSYQEKRNRQSRFAQAVIFLNTLEREIFSIFIDLVASAISQFLTDFFIFNESRDKMTWYEVNATQSPIFVRGAIEVRTNNMSEILAEISGLLISRLKPLQ